MTDGYKYSDITGRIIGCAIKVHTAIKNGRREAVYQRCLAIEMEKAGLNYRAEVDMPIYLIT